MTEKMPKPLSPALGAFLSFVRMTPLKRGITRRHLMKFMLKRIDHPVITDFRGVPIILRLDNTTEQKALFGYYDLIELDFLKEQALRVDDPVFVDLGANAGFYTQNFLALGRGTVLAIEPNPKMIKRIVENDKHLSAVGHAKARLIIEDCAVGPEHGEAFLDLSQGFGAANIKNSAGAQTLPVRVAPLTDVLQKHGIKKIDIMKVDVEGYEDRALGPFFESADPSLYPRRIVIEHTSTDRWEKDLFALLQERGYRTLRRTRGNLLLEYGGTAE